MLPMAHASGDGGRPGERRGQHRRPGRGAGRAAAPDRRPAGLAALVHRSAIATPLAVAIEPTRETLGYGQVNLLLFALIMADLVALRWRSRRGTTTARSGDGPLLRFVYSGAWAGVGIGLATAVKLTPALFILYLMITRQWRVAVTAVGTTIGVTLGSLRRRRRRVPDLLHQRAVADRAGRRRRHDAQPVPGRPAGPALRLDRDPRPALARVLACWCWRSACPGRPTPTPTVTS